MIYKNKKKKKGRDYAVCCLTPTGDRPEAFALCTRYVLRQTFTDFEWVVVDDGASPIEITAEIEDAAIPITVVRAKPIPNNSLGRNLLIGLEHCVQTQYIAFIEDDDYYGSTWLADSMDYLATNPLVELYGEARAKYYHIGLNYYVQLTNKRHASLCQTIVRRNLVPMLKNIFRDEHLAPFFDMPLWALAVAGSKEKYHLVAESENVVGIKGMPGRHGIGVGHRVDYDGWNYDDENLSILKSWIGDDYMLYQPYMRQYAPK